MMASLESGRRSCYREHHFYFIILMAEAEEVMRPYTSSSGPHAMQGKSGRAAWSRMGIDRAAGAGAVLVRGYFPIHFMLCEILFSLIWSP